ncbi:NAPDH-dependent diflavin reductase [Hypoxylon texense]
MGLEHYFHSSTVVTAIPSECPARGDGRIVVTSYSITHTSTTTWSGDPADYTPPYPSISIPVPCTPKETPTGRFTITFCDSTGETCTFIHTTTIETSTANNLIPNPSPTTETVTFTTTDKNPVVVFPTETPPSYGGPPADPPSHDTIVVGGGSTATTPNYGMLTTNVDSAKSSPTPPTSSNSYVGGAPITVIAQPGEVIIDDHTFTDNLAQKTSTVIVGTDTFVIEPSRVIGAGVTLTRPPSNLGSVATPDPAPIPIPGSIPISEPIPIPGPVSPPEPITTTVGGIGVVYGPSSVATIDGTVFTIEPTSTVVVVRGQTVTLGPTGIIFPSQTLHVAAGSGPTQTAVMGGELITAIGTDKVVIEGTTITYGHGSSSTITTVIDGETVLIAPTGVIVHDTVLGGVTAVPSATKYEIVGGATITQMGLTAVEISGKTFHIGLGAGASTAVTTVIGGHTLTIGPKGVSMSTWTLSAPYAAATTTIIMPGSSGGGNNNAAMTIPTATGSPNKENSASMPHCDWIRGLLAAVGVGCLGPLLFWL